MKEIDGIIQDVRDSIKTQRNLVISEDAIRDVRDSIKTQRSSLVGGGITKHDLSDIGKIRKDMGDLKDSIQLQTDIITGKRKYRF